jgi:hypothetical protein
MFKDIEPIMSRKLTKKFFMELPENVYIVSNLFIQKDVSLYDDKVASVSKREIQWKKIVETSVDQRKCHIFRNKADYKKWLKQLVEIWG